MFIIRERQPFYLKEDYSGRSQYATSSTVVTDDDSFGNSFIGGSFVGSDEPAIKIQYAPNGSGSNVHFKITFYLDSDFETAVYSTFSLFDQKRWYLIDNYNALPYEMGPSGASASDDENFEISGILVLYNPEVLPPKFASEQEQYKISGNFDIFERQLVPGVSYYVKIEAYEDGSFYDLDSIVYKVKTSKINKNIIENDNIDKKNWISEANGYASIKVNKHLGSCIHPSLNKRNWSDRVYVSWVEYAERASSDYDIVLSSGEGDVYVDGLYDRVPSYPIIKYGYWSSLNYNFYTSGQRTYDYTIYSDTYFIAPAARNFYIDYDIYFNVSCIFYIKQYDLLRDHLYYYTNNVDTVESESDAVTYLLGSTASSSDRTPLIRVLDSDIVSTINSAKDIVLPIVEDIIVRLEITNVSGAYAVRLKNENDKSWSTWMGVDNWADNDLLAYNVYKKDSNSYDSDSAYLVFRPYSTDDDSVIAPWILSPGNGLKTVFCQILTYDGVLSAVKLNLLSNISGYNYSLNVANDSLYTSESESFSFENVNKYNGKEVVRGGGYVGVRVAFEDFDKIKSHFNIFRKYSTKYSNYITYTDDPEKTLDQNLVDNFLANLSFNVIQNGYTVIMNQPFSQTLSTERQSGVFVGVFNLPSTDDVFIMDGDAIITVNIPDVFEIFNYKNYIDDSNIYNPINLLNDNSHEFMAVNPIDVSGVKRVIDSNRLNNILKDGYINELYNRDDPKFYFGNKRYWNK